MNAKGIAVYFGGTSFGGKSFAFLARNRNNICEDRWRYSDEVIRYTETNGLNGKYSMALTKEAIMKKVSKWLTIACAGLLMAGAFASTASAKLPSSMDEYRARYASEAKTPEGAAKLWFEAVFLYQNDETKSLGRQMLLDIMKSLPDDFDRNSGYAKMVERIKNNPEIFRSFCAGSSPSNNYKADVDNCELTVTSSREEAENTYAVFLKSSGADSPRPMKLTQVDGLWKASSVSSLYLQVQPAKK